MLLVPENRLIIVLRANWCKLKKMDLQIFPIYTYLGQSMNTTFTVAKIRAESRRNKFSMN